ncbi:MAG: hypothetical protein IJP43_10765 [Oscillospiraceae bacterium]|nr:hypothetical protein [Oscillospiraceae bacterium]
MTALIVIGIILLIFFLIAIIPVGVRVGYDKSGFSLDVIAAFIKIGILPPKEKKPKPQEKPKEDKPKEEKTEEKPEEEKPEEKPREKSEHDLGGTVELAMTALRAVGDTLTRLRRKLTVDYIRLQYTSNCDDPADAAINYGRAVAAINGLSPFVSKFLRIKKRDYTVLVGFDGGGDKVLLDAQITIRIWEIIYVALGLAPVIKAYLKWSKSGKGKDNGQK